MTLLYFFQKPAYVQQSAAYINKQNTNIRFEKNKKNAKEWSWKEWVLPLGKMAILLPKSTEKFSVVLYANLSLVYYSPIFCLGSDVSKFHMPFKNSWIFLKMLALRNVLRNAFSNFFKRRNSELFFPI